MMERHTAYICAGSNIGDKQLNCKNGIDALTMDSACVLKGQSAYYKTAPVDYRDQDWFVNVVFKIETTLDPLQLLAHLKSIEQEAGRLADTVRFGPRILDLDIIFYDDLVMHTPRLVIPHPRMHKRRFVLKPICDIDPEAFHPIFKKSVQQLLDLLGEDGQMVVVYS